MLCIIEHFFFSQCKICIQNKIENFSESAYWNWMGAYKNKATIIIITSSSLDKFILSGESLVCNILSSLCMYHDFFKNNHLVLYVHRNCHLLLELLPNLTLVMISQFQSVMFDTIYMSSWQPNKFACNFMDLEHY